MPKEKTYCFGPDCKEEIEVSYCCNAFDCGCGGLPVDPPFCSEECYEAYIDANKAKPLTPLDLG